MQRLFIRKYQNSLSNVYSIKLGYTILGLLGRCLYMLLDFLVLLIIWIRWPIRRYKSRVCLKASRTSTLLAHRYRALFSFVVMLIL